MVQTELDTALPDATPRERELIERADELGRTSLARDAAAVDEGTLSARAQLEQLAAAGLASIRVPRDYGGEGVGEGIYLRVLEGLCYGDGTTPFVVAQHYGTSAMIARSANSGLKDCVLPAMARGELFAGFGISQVRRQGKPALAATPHGGGFRFDGFIPWMTGESLFDYVVIAGTLPDDKTLLAWVPFVESDNLRLNPPMELVAMNGARTIAATCRGLEVGPADIVAVEPPGRRLRANTTTVPCLYGLARASIDDLARLAEKRQAPASADAAARLRERLERQRRHFYAALPTLDAAPEAALAAIRAEATGLALDAVGALIVATGGGANARTHPAQRRLREMSVFATWGVSIESVNVAVSLLARER